ncbi:hypothetical protein V5799_013922 [Amblyomma americanum]|uniref:Uncharacterized protein n=1 Tax=Amblyomma americanum TaxID=6943 RepID=A0AAQ4E4I6_AMBAM
MSGGAHVACYGARGSFPNRPGGPQMTTTLHVMLVRPMSKRPHSASSSRKSLDERHLAREERSKGSRFSDRRRAADASSEGDLERPGLSSP